MTMKKTTTKKTAPTAAPTAKKTAAPTAAPTAKKTAAPTAAPKGKAKKTAAPTAAPKGKAKKTAAPTAPTAPTPRHTKKGEALELLKKGVSLETLMTKFGWQRHTVRGFISILGKTQAIESAAVEGVRTYKISGGK
jgi:hypothetical protein